MKSMSSAAALGVASLFVSAPAAAQVETRTFASSEIFASWHRVAELWTRHTGTRPHHIIIQTPGPTLGRVGATPGRLTTACMVVIGEAAKDENGVRKGSNRPCNRTVSLFAHFDPSIEGVDDPFEEAAIAVGELQGFRPPFRMSVRGEPNWDLGEGRGTRLPHEPR